MRKALIAGTAAFAVVGSAFLATPASAESTTVTFTAGLTGTTVSILPQVALVGVTSGSTVTGTMATVVTDLRPAGGGWTVSASTAGFSLAGATSPTGTAFVDPANVKLWNSAAVVTVPGTATVTNSHSALASALTLSGTAQSLVTATTANVNVTTLTQGVQIDVTGKDTGLYTGTIVQTVA